MIIRTFTSILLLFFAITLQSQSKLDSLLTTFNGATTEDERYEILDPLTHQMVRANHPEQLAYLDTLLMMAFERKDYDMAAQKSRYIIYQLNYKLEYDASFKLIDSILKFKDQFKNPKSEAHLLLKKGGVHFALTEFNKAIDDYQSSLPLFYKSGDSIFAADALYFSGQAYYLSGNFSEAIQNFDEAQKLYIQLGDEEYANLVALESINLLNSNGLREIGQKRYIELLQTAKATENFCLASIIYLNMIFSDIKMGNSISISYDEVSSVIGKCDDPYKKLRNRFYLKVRQVKDAVEGNDTVNASNYFNELLKIEKELKDPYELTYSISAKVAYYIFTDNLQQAIVALDEYFELTKNYPISNHKVKIEKLASDAYTEIGNIAMAKKHLDTYVKFKDSLFTASAANSYSFYQTQFETAKKENEIISQEASIQQLQNEKEITKNKTKTLYVLLISLLIIISGVGYYFLERSGRKRRYLAKKLNLRKAELNDFTNRLLEKGNEHEKLKKEFEHLNSLYGEVEELKELQTLADSKILTADDWSDFKEKFKIVYPNFFFHLKNKGYKFTNAEERLITLEKLDLKTSEIANMLAISPDSVLTGRYRLRKKLKAPKDIAIIEYLES